MKKFSNNNLSFLKFNNRGIYIVFFFAVLLVTIIIQQRLLSNQNEKISRLKRSHCELDSQFNEVQKQLHRLNKNQTEIEIIHRELARNLRRIRSAPVFKIAKRYQAINQDVQQAEFKNPLTSKEIFLLENKLQNIKNQSVTLLLTSLDAGRLLDNMPHFLPTDGYISSHFGLRSDPFNGNKKFHKGLDIAALTGTPVYAPAPGLVVTSKNNRSYGKMIVIDHDGELSSTYAHLSSSLVKKGEKVQRGQMIATIGQTGTRCQGPHLHYELNFKGRNVDPLNFVIDRKDPYYSKQNEI